MAASEFLVGANRFPFALVSRDGQPLEGAIVQVRFYHLDVAKEQVRAEASASWRTIGQGTAHVHGDEAVPHFHIRGAYIVDEVSFDTPGYWQAEFEAVTAEGTRVPTGTAAFEVKERSSAPAIGQRVPATENPTIHDVPFREISTRPVERDDMHNVSVAQALEAGQPFVVLFASPAFCVSAICGPVTEEVARVHGRFKGQVEFIHIEPWDLALARGEGRLQPGAEMREWALPSEPWTFVIDGEGHVFKRFEGLVTEAELLPAVEAVLAAHSS